MFNSIKNSLSSMLGAKVRSLVSISLESNKGAIYGSHNNECVKYNPELITKKFINPQFSKRKRYVVKDYSKCASKSDKVWL